MIAGLGHYDDPLPGIPGGRQEWRAADRFRFASQLRAWIDVDGSGRVTGCGYGEGGCPIGSTTIRPGGAFHRRVVPSMVALSLALDGRLRPAHSGGGALAHAAVHEPVGPRLGLPHDARRPDDNGGRPAPCRA